MLTGNKFMQVVLQCITDVDEIRSREWFVEKIGTHKYRVTGYHPIGARIDIIKDNIYI